MIAFALLGISQATVWSGDLTVADLALKLGPAYSAAPDVAQRRVAVFALGQPAKTIADKVSSCLGLRMEGARFVEDLSYKRAVSTYETQLDQFASEALRKGIDLLLGSPVERDLSGMLNRRLEHDTNLPWDPRQELLNDCARVVAGNGPLGNALSCLTDSQLGDLVNGVPVLTNTAPLIARSKVPLAISDFSFPPTLKRGNVAITFTGRSLQMSLYAPTRGDPIRNSFAQSLVGTADRTPPEWTDLGKWMRTWTIRESTESRIVAPALPINELVDQSRYLELIATSSKVPLVAEVIPQPKLGRSGRYDVVEGGDSSWILLKPSGFWRQQEMWTADARVRSWKPVGSLEPILAADWMVALALSGLTPDLYNNLPVRAWFGDGLGYHSSLARLWTSLTPGQKQSVLGAGINRRALTSAQRVLFDFAVTSVVVSSIPRKDVSGLFDVTANSKLRTVTEPIWAHGDSRQNVLFTSQAAMEASLKQNKDRPFRSKGLRFTWRFETSGGHAQIESHVLQPIAPDR